MTDRAAAGPRAIVEAMFQEAGLYLLDESEAALSFQSCLSLVRLFHRLGQGGAQIICSTHSPLLAATPGAAIVQLDEAGFHQTTWTDLAVVDHWRRLSPAEWCKSGFLIVVSVSVANVRGPPRESL